MITIKKFRKHHRDKSYSFEKKKDTQKFKTENRYNLIVKQLVSSFSDNVERDHMQSLSLRDENQHMWCNCYKFVLIYKMEYLAGKKDAIKLSKHCHFPH